MGSEQDKILSLQSGEEFSGFSSLSEDDMAQSHSASAKKKKKSKSVAFKIPKKSKAYKENKKGSSVASLQSPSTSASGVFDFTKLSPADISKLREVLGVSSQNQQQHMQYVEDQDLANEEDISAIFGRSLEDLPGMTIEVDNTEGTMEENDATCLTEDLNQALFDTVDINSSDWETPRLKTPKKDKPVSSKRLYGITVVRVIS